MNNSSEPQDCSTTQPLSYTVHAWVSLSGHCSVCINHRTSKDDWRKSQTEDISNFSNICHTNSIQVLICMDFFVDFGCALQMTFWKLMKKCCLYLEPLSETGSLWEQGKHKLNPMQTEVGL